MQQRIRKLTFLSLCVALAMILGYLESLIPFFVGIPGIKLGLSNLVIVWILYTYEFKDALLVNIVRVILNSILFGNIYSFLFSLSGGIFSLISMNLFKRFNFYIYSVSMMGGITHNIAQCMVAILTTSVQMLYYLPVLLVSGLICGIINGMITQKITPYLKSVK